MPLTDLQRAHVHALNRSWARATAPRTDPLDRGLPDGSWWAAPDAQTRDGFRALLPAHVARMSKSRFGKIILAKDYELT